MANIKSQMKRNRQNEKRRLRNRATRSDVRTHQKAAEAAAGTEDEAEAMRMAVKRIDKAVAKGVMHKNAGARKKSRLMARVARLGAES
ncbi:MAG: 30S ribosomal protein S20 [Actinomycetota bacterium]